MTALLYLHGVGDDGTRRDWWDQLGAVTGQSLDNVTVIAPDFADLLTNKARLIPTTAASPLTTADFSSDRVRRRYRSDQAALNTQLRNAGSASVWPYRRKGFSRVPGVLDAIGEKLVMGVIFEEVGKYNGDEQRRRAVLARVISLLPTDEPVVILGHSLGALVALDLIMHLPDGLEVPLLVTAASALARRRLPPDVAELPRRFPYDRVGGWINVFNPSDAVTRGLPIGMRFPQAIDVTVKGTLGDHNLRTCLLDPGVADALARSLDPGPPAAATPGRAVIEISREPLTRRQAMELATVQIAFYMEQLIAEQADTSPEALAQFTEARRMAGERAALRSAATHHDWDRDHAHDLWHLVAEKDIASVLVRIAGVNPFAPMKVPVPRVISEDARRRVAVDAGLSPGWVDVAAKSLLDAALVFRPMRKRSRSEAEEPLPMTDDDEAAHITAAVRASLLPLGVADSMGTSRLTSGLGDIRPVCIELLARALTAQRLGIPLAGSEERTVLSRLMVLLGDHRARILQQVGNHDRLLAELRRRTATVGASLSWLADQGVGLAPVR